jgi:hypothetical protein
MKKALLLFSLLLILTSVFAGDRIVTGSMTLSDTRQLLSSTNSTAGTAVTFPISQTPVAGTFYLSGFGILATTNAAGSTANFRVVLGFAPDASDANAYTTPVNSSHYIELSSMGQSTNKNHEWFPMYGKRSFKVMQVQNPFLGAVSNITLNYEFWVKE